MEEEMGLRVTEKRTNIFHKHKKSLKEVKETL